MIGYDKWHWDEAETMDRVQRQVERMARKAAARNPYPYGRTRITVTMTPCAQVESAHKDALIDIAHDCGTLEAAQRRAKQALSDGATP